MPKPRLSELTTAARQAASRIHGGIEDKTRDGYLVVGNVMISIDTKDEEFIATYGDLKGWISKELGVEKTCAFECQKLARRDAGWRFEKALQALKAARKHSNEEIRIVGDGPNWALDLLDWYYLRDGSPLPWKKKQRNASKPKSFTRTQMQERINELESKVAQLENENEKLEDLLEDEPLADELADTRKKLEQEKAKVKKLQAELTKYRKAA